ncbi:hypothetical protein [Comamonas testosteroni]|jgi:hypothetical protein|uniref:hypothetical protein n=1 Tax=Comamonas testosteroni TaxID=285 RepID=UPI0026F241DB|nr:hypothetical protein [Comamonas testosteroni]
MIKQEHNQKPDVLPEPEIKVYKYEAPVNPADDEFRAMWRAEGGEFPWHPYSWAGCMQEDKLLTLMRELVALRAASTQKNEAPVVGVIERLRAAVEAADHKPGDWHRCGEEKGRICVLPEHEHKPQPKTLLESVRRFGDGHNGIGREFSARDLALVVEAINSLPELLSLAEDGDKYRALAASERTK